MTMVFACYRCGWRGPSLWELLAHPCAALPEAAAEIPEPEPAAVLPPVVMFNCANCGKETAKAHRRRKFCSDACSVAFHNAAQLALLQRQRASANKAPEPRTLYPPEPRHENTEAVKMVATKPLHNKYSPARRSRVETMFGAAKPAALPAVRPAATSDDSLAHDVWVEPEQLPAGGSAPAAGEPTPNPSHPVRSHIKPASWRRVTPEREERLRYCVCGVALPAVVPEKCPECGRPVNGVTK